MKKLIILLMLTICYASQDMGHILTGREAWKITDAVCSQNNLIWAKPIVKPMAAIGSHFVMDKVIGEAALGEWQVYIGVVRAIIGYFTVPVEEQGDYLQYSFWALSPDIAQKMLGWNWAHPEISGPKIFNLDRDQNELLEELLLASLIFKVEIKF